MPGVLAEIMTRIDQDLVAVDAESYRSFGLADRPVQDVCHHVVVEDPVRTSTWSMPPACVQTNATSTRSHLGELRSCPPRHR